MAQIRNVGPGIRTTGQTAGLVYVHVKGKTYTRALPIMPSGMFRTPEAKKRQALFTLVSWHMKQHAATIKRAFSRGKYWSPRNNYYHKNAKALNEALDALAETYATGGRVSVDQIEQAIATYATAHPDAIQIGGLEGFTPVFLTGAWPDTITLTDESGDHTTVVIVTSSGTTTHAPDNSGDSNTGGSTGGGSTPSTPTNPGGSGGSGGDDWS